MYVHDPCIETHFAFSLKAHDYQNTKSMIEGKVISRFKLILHKVEGPKDQENVNE
jgi:hypothetical protein